MLYKYFDKTNKLKKEVEVQGTKKLGSVKGVQALELKEMKQIDGGIAPLGMLLIGAVIGWALSQDVDKMVDSFNEGYNRARK